MKYRKLNKKYADIILLLNKEEYCHWPFCNLKAVRRFGEARYPDSNTIIYGRRRDKLIQGMLKPYTCLTTSNHYLFWVL